MSVFNPLIVPVACVFCQGSIHQPAPVPLRLFQIAMQVVLWFVLPQVHQQDLPPNLNLYLLQPLLLYFLPHLAFTSAPELLS